MRISLAVTMFAALTTAYFTSTFQAMAAHGSSGRQRTYVISWDLQPMSNYVVTVQADSTAYGIATWTTNVTGANSIAIPLQMKSPSFTAFIAGQAAEVQWNYDTTAGPGISFNLYEMPNTETNWYAVTNFPGAIRAARCFMFDPFGYVSMTASNSVSEQESSASNPAGWTNRVGEQIPLDVIVQ